MTKPKSIKEPNSLKFTSDDKIKDAGEMFFFNKQQSTELEAEKLEGLKQDREERKIYAKRIFNFIVIWCAAVLIILVLYGCNVLKFDEKVIITLITTTTANILTLFYLVTKYLFFRNSKK